MERIGPTQRSVFVLMLLLLLPPVVGAQGLGESHDLRVDALIATNPCRNYWTQTESFVFGGTSCVLDFGLSARQQLRSGSPFLGAFGLQVGGSVDSDLREIHLLDPTRQTRAPFTEFRVRGLVAAGVAPRFDSGAELRATVGFLIHYGGWKDTLERYFPVESTDVFFLVDNATSLGIRFDVELVWPVGIKGHRLATTLAVELRNEVAFGYRGTSPPEQEFVTNHSILESDVEMLFLPGLVLEFPQHGLVAPHIAFGAGMTAQAYSPPERAALLAVGIYPFGRFDNRLRFELAIGGDVRFARGGG